MQIPKYWNGDCGGLANQMWRFAVLYSLAKSIGRFPGISYTNTWTCEKLNSPREIENTFPDVEGIDNSFYDRTFEDDCCKYYNPKDDNSHKFCVFTRRGDFIKPEWKKWHKATDKEFTEKAIGFIIGNELKVCFWEKFLKSVNFM
uniref:Uncharacterized protein n=1 Tax=Meloidogyne javanica TaxID=6303 RepID=A0A915M3Q1_MELJA